MARTLFTIGIFSFQTVYLDVMAGSFKCSNYIPCAGTPAKNDFDCAASGGLGTNNSNPTCQSGTDLPPLEILVDYGDGSGPNTWTRGNMLELWSHVYTRPGEYYIAVHSMSHKLLQKLHTLHWIQV